MRHISKMWKDKFYRAVALLLVVSLVVSMGGVQIASTYGKVEESFDKYLSALRTSF